jgi:hypothetical protein
MVKDLTQERDEWKRQYEVLASQNEYHRKALKEQNDIVEQIQIDHAQETMQYWDENTQKSQENEVLKIKLERATTNQDTYKKKVDQLTKNYTEVSEAGLLVIQENQTLKEQLQQATTKIDELTDENAKLKQKSKKRKLKDLIKFKGFKKVKS